MHLCVHMFYNGGKNFDVSVVIYSLGLSWEAHFQGISFKSHFFCLSTKFRQQNFLNLLLKWSTHNFQLSLIQPHHNSNSNESPNPHPNQINLTVWVCPQFYVINKYTFQYSIHIYVCVSIFESLCACDNIYVNMPVHTHTHTEKTATDYIC